MLQTMRRPSSPSVRTFGFLLLLVLTSFLPLAAQTPPPIPSGDVRIHYFRPDGNYIGWTVYAFGDTTEPNNFGAGPVAVTGQDSFGAYFDVGVTGTAQSVGIIIHKANYKDPGPNEMIDPATQGNEYWAISGSNVLATTQPPTIQQTDPSIPAGKLRIHYFRPDNNYGGWSVYPFQSTTDPSGSWCATEDYVSGYDNYGAYYDVGADMSSSANQLGFIIHNCNTGVKDPGPNQYLQVDQQGWVISGNTAVYTQQPVTEYKTDPPIPSGKARIHYYRPDGNYSGWSLYPFFATSDPTGNWCSTEDYIAGYDSYGAFYDVGINPSLNGGQLGFIIHNCTTGAKDPGPDQHLQITTNLEAWVISGDSTVYLSQPTAAQLLNGTFLQRQAFWIDRTTVAIPSQFLASGWSYFLNYDPAANLTLTSTGITGGGSLALTPATGFTTAKLARFPQLLGYAVLHLPANTQTAALAKILKGELALSAVAGDGTLKYATSIQDAGVLDDLFYYSGKLGVIFHHNERDCWYDWDDDDNAAVKIKVWAPTAQSMSLLLYEHPNDTAPLETVRMHQHNGVWVARGTPDWEGKYYLFALTVYVPDDHSIHNNVSTDPYSVDISLNGTMSRITDLEADWTMPRGWERSAAPPLRSQSDFSVYELHIRDFSVDDPTVPAMHKGTYLAFTDQWTNGMQHLRALAQSGLKAVHLLPSFHFASINEDKSTWKTTPNLNGLPPDSDQQQAAVAAIQGSDAFNWGYDPVHYMTPEGSYAVHPDNRVNEYRQMVMGLHSAGLRVVQDVVFNHTSASGETPNANLDLIVPGYYHRLDLNGSLQTGSCCPDTASEHRMMEKLIVDSVVLNAREYKIDGFRFDLMSFMFVSTMQHIQAALARLTPEKDGVDGRKIYLYGEGFDFGEVANNALGVNASQVNLYGNGIGTFNDRIRDGIRGGSPFTDQRVQGFATGLFTDPSTYTSQNQSQPDQQTTLLQQSDWIRVGLTGNLRDYSFTSYTGQTVTGAQVNYNGQPTGYAASPIESINYCSVHDNQALFDAVQLKSASNDTMATRVRRQNLAESLIALGQGIPFFLGGDDLLRSKDMDGNSYDSGDWFNKIDFSFQTNNWGIGLPIASQNQGNWPIMQPLLANPALKATAADIRRGRDHFRELMEMRYSSGLFRMQSFAEVAANLHFLNVGPSQTPGLIVMKLDANGGAYGRYQHVLVVFNATMQTQAFSDASLQGIKLHLHPVEQSSGDPTVRQSSFNRQQGSATVPALTTAVFVSEQ